MYFKVSDLDKHDNGLYFAYHPRQVKTDDFLFLDFEDGSSPLQLSQTESIESNHLVAYKSNDNSVNVAILVH